MSAELEDRLSEKPPQMPDKYTWLRQSGLCLNFHMGLCVPTLAINDARSKLSIGVEQDSVIDAVLTQVVAIKAPKEDQDPHCQPAMHSEVRTLQKIRDHTYTRSGGEHCSEILDHFDMEAMAQGEPGWLIMASTPLCCDIEGLREFDTFPNLPKGLLWIVITQLYEAVWFLQCTCDPPITHGRILADAILISFPYKHGERAATKRPEITLGGFGRSYIHGTTSEDVKLLADTMHDLIDMCYDHKFESRVSTGRRPPGKMRRPPMPLGLKDDSPDEVKKFSPRNVEDLEGLWAAIGKFATDQLEKVREEVWDELRDLVHEVSEFEGDLKNIVKGILTAQPVKE